MGNKLFTGKWIVISFYTIDYKEDVAKLKESLEKFKIPYDIEEVQKTTITRNDWLEVCKYKAVFVKKMLQKYPGKDIVWLDADAIVQQYPVLFDEIKCDIAIHYRRGNEVLSGTIFMNSNTKTLALCDRWIARNNNPSFHGQLEQVSLKNAIIGDLNVYRLPPEYTKIFDLMKKNNEGGDPVIEHFQSSRRYKRIK